jgi:hypothetical protein
MRKKIFIVFVILFPLIVGLGCRFSKKPDPTATPTEEPAVNPSLAAPTVTVEKKETESPSLKPYDANKDLVVVKQSAIYKKDTIVFFGFLIENTSTHTTYEGVDFTIQLFSPNGNLIDTSYAYLTQFYPETTQGITATFWLPDEEEVAASTDIRWTVAGVSFSSDLENPLTLEKLSYWENIDFPIVTGKIVNHTPAIYTNLRTDVLCYDAADEIVGGGTVYIDFIHPNNDLGFTVYVDTFGEVSRVDAFPTITFTSDVIEESNLISQVEVLDSHFYEDSSGAVNGGLIIKNTGDSVLRNIYAYITYFDQDGNIATTGSVYLNLLLPDDIIGITPWNLILPDGANMIDYSILLLPLHKEDDYDLNENPFRINSIKAAEDDNRYAQVNFTNTYSKTITEVDAYVLGYNAEGKIIGGGMTWLSDPILPGGEGNVEVLVDCQNPEVIDHFEAWVVPFDWTRFE